MSWPIPTSSTMWWHSSSLVFDVLVDEVFVKFVVEFGWILDMMAKSYVDGDVKAQVFDRVRLVSGCHAQMLRRRYREGTGLRCSSASSEDFVWVMSDFVVGCSFAVML